MSRKFWIAIEMVEHSGGRLRSNQGVDPESVVLLTLGKGRPESRQIYMHIRRCLLPRPLADTWLAGKGRLNDMSPRGRERGRGPCA